MDQSEQYLRQIKQLLDTLEEDELQHMDSSLADNTEKVALPLQTESSGEFSSPHINNAPPTTLKNFPGRGIGVVATRLIPAGTVILQEDATLTEPDPQGAITLESLFNLVSRYVGQSAAIRQRVLGLHAYARPHQENSIRGLLAAGSGDSQLTVPQVGFIHRLYSTFTTNKFDNTAPSTSSLYLDASRFNHCCLPNCDYGHTSEDNRTTITIISSRDIQPDEELTVTYLDIYQPRDERRADTERCWGFVCNCPACDVADPTVDTAAHEQRLAQYIRPKQDPYIQAVASASLNSLSLKDFDEALQRSIQRTQIAQALGDNYTAMRNHVVSSAICRRRWLLTGDEEDLNSQIRFLELGRPLAKRLPPSNSGQAMTRDLERFLRKARELKGAE